MTWPNPDTISGLKLTGAYLEAEIRFAYDPRRREALTAALIVVNREIMRKRKTKREARKPS